MVPLALLLLPLAACSGRDSMASSSAVSPVPVVAVAVKQKAVPIQLSVVGTVQPYLSVAIKARIDGQLETVHFREGEPVRRGQPLFSLDPRSLQAQVDQAGATLAKDRASYANAMAQDTRYADLLGRNFISKEFYTQIHTNLETARATVAQDQAALRNARIQLAYARIEAPIDGVAGKVLIQRGNMIKANDVSPLVVINQVAPIYVEFAVPEQNLPAIRAAMAQHEVAVEALPEAGPHVKGTLSFIDNSVDTTTGTIRLRASFSNQDRALWPGQFVTATVILGEQRDAVVVPSPAVQAGPEGALVFVVKPDSSVELRTVAAERSVGGEVVIAKGLAPGEQVVVDGQSRLASGTTVTLQSKTPEARP